MSISPELETWFNQQEQYAATGTTQTTAPPLREKSSNTKEDVPDNARRTSSKDTEGRGRKSAGRGRMNECLTIVLAVLLAASFLLNATLYVKWQKTEKRYETLQTTSENDLKHMESRARTYYIFYKMAEDILSEGWFQRIKTAAEESIKLETLWVFDPKWGY